MIYFVIDHHASLAVDTFVIIYSLLPHFHVRLSPPFFFPLLFTPPHPSHFPPCIPLHQPSSSSMSFLTTIPFLILAHIIVSFFVNRNAMNRSLDALIKLELKASTADLPSILSALETAQNDINNIEVILSPPCAIFNFW